MYTRSPDRGTVGAVEGVPVRVLFADKLPDRARLRLVSQGFEVRSEPKLEGDSLAARLGDWDPHVVVVRSTKFGAAHAAAGRSLQLVVRAGAGTDTIDVGACSGRAVLVANCPGKNAVAVAELTLGLLLAIDRRIPDAVADLRAGRWAKGKYSAASGLRTRTLGILGMGSIGREVATRAAAFGMNVIAWSRSLTPEKAAAYGVSRRDDPVQVAREADVLTVHVDGKAKGLVGEAVLAALKPGAIVLNTTRAGVVDEAALLAALDAKGLRAGLDVFAGEPSGAEGAFDHPLAKHPNVVGTHHIGASTDEAQEAVGDEACRIIEAFAARGTVDEHNAVNLSKKTAATHRLDVRHLDRVGVLANVFGLLREASINVQDMQNVIFPDGAAIARIQVASEPSADTLARLGGLDHVLGVSAVALA